MAKWPRGQVKRRSHSTTRPLDHSTTFLVGVGGNAGSGKSTFVKELARLGARVIDADRIGRQLLEKGTPTARQVLKEFGPGILNSRNAIDRKKLGAIVFARPAARRKLNRIVHPVLLREIQRQVKAITNDECGVTNGRLRCNRSPLFVNRQSSIVIVLDAALLFLWNWQRKVDIAVLVSSARQNKLRRLADQGLTLTEARNRLASQLSEPEMRRKADLVIPNNGTVTELKARARRFYRLLQTELQAII